MLVVDSPANDPAATPGVTTTGPMVDYDVDGNGLVDEDHGHGVFVAALVEQLAPGADVMLAGVNGGHLSASEPLVADGVLGRRRHRRDRSGLRAVGDGRRDGRSTS